MRLIFLLALLVGCSNEAVQYAQATMPGADCDKFHTSWHDRKDDTAICRYEHAVWLCQIEREPSCKKVRDLPAEVPAK